MNLFLNEKTQYSITKTPSDEDLKKIDTTVFYVQIFEARYYNSSETSNPQVIVFHKNGFSKHSSVRSLEKFDQNRKKNSVFYGGKYKIEGNEIVIERFLPVHPDKSDWFKRSIKKGTIEEDKIIFKDKTLVTVFKKTYYLPATSSREKRIHSPPLLPI